MSAIGNIANLLLNHPLSRGDRLGAVTRFLRWQFAIRIGRFDAIVPYVDDTVLVVRRGMTGATGAIYVGLMEPDDMSFALHLLRDGDLFGDIGSNVGVYTVLASGARGARSIAVEPVLQTFGDLRRNMAVNFLDDLVETRQVGIGSREGILHFSTGEDAANHVVTDGSGASVPVVTLDMLFAENPPTLLKIDVEGFETEVINGGGATLANPALKAIIIELNGAGTRYGYDETAIDYRLREIGFETVAYDFRNRALQTVPFSAVGNSIYVRDRAFVEDRLRTAPPFRILSQSF